MWLTGLVAPRHVGSSQTRARTRVPCIGRQILNHCATREAQDNFKDDKEGNLPYQIAQHIEKLKLLKNKKALVDRSINKPTELNQELKVRTTFIWKLGV